MSTDWKKKANTRQWIIGILEQRIDRLEKEIRELKKEEIS